MGLTLTMWLSIGNGGWVAVGLAENEDGDDPEAPIDLLCYVRLRLEPSGWRACEIYFDGSDRPLPLRPATIREFPLAVLEDWIRSDGDLACHLEQSAGVVSPDLSTLASHFGSIIGSKATSWVAESFRDQMQSNPKRVRKVQQFKKRVRRPNPPDVRLSGRPLAGVTDEFLGDVARAYASAVHQGHAPAPRLAKDAGVSPKTVHSWVKRARDRGIMPPPQQGRVTY